jgi:flagellar assembly protein FliH
MAEEKKIVSLIDQLLQEKDPATVGLRRILKSKREVGKQFPLQEVQFEEFESPQRKSKIFSEEERHVLELEKELNRLQTRIHSVELKARQDVDAALKKGLQQGRTEGFDQGYQKAKGEAEIQMGTLQQRFAALLARYEQQHQSIIIDAEHMLVKLATSLARKVVNAELAQNPQVIVAVVKKALAHVVERERVIIRVSPVDYEQLSGRTDFWAPVTERLSTLQVESDERIETGGCIIESSAGVIDAQRATQMQELEELIERTWLASSASREQAALGQES